MALLARHQHQNLMWPTDVFRRMFDFDWAEAGWLRIEEFTDGKQLVIRAELPGIDPDKDVEIAVADGVLRVHAERREEHETVKDGYRSEFRYGSFEREVPLPAGLDPAAVEATYQDGILTVKVPLPPEKEVRKVIPVKKAA